MFFNGCLNLQIMIFIYVFDFNILLNGCLISINSHSYTFVYITAVCKNDLHCKLILRKSLSIANFDFVYKHE